MKRAIPMLMVARTAPPHVFAPTDITGLVFMSQADNLSLADNDPVDTWTDLSGSGNTVTAASTARPTFKTNIQNSKPILRFDGSANVMNKASFVGVDGLSAMTIFIAVRQATFANDKVFVSKWDYATQGSWAWQTAYDSANPNQQIGEFVADSLIDPGNNKVESTDNNTIDSFCLLAMVYDGSQSAANRVKFYKNGTLLSSSVTGTLPTSLTTCTADFRIGQFGGSLTRNFNGDFGEIEIFNSALSANDMTSMWNYLNGRWAAY